MSEDLELVEETLTIIDEVFVYKLPPRASAEGYKATEWDLEHPIWSGRVRVTSKGLECFIRLEDKSGTLFALCCVRDHDKPPAVEPVLDSSRYYVLKLVDERSQRVAFIGIGFNDRAFSFDFKAALQDHERYIRQQKELKENPPQYKHVDLSFQAGQTIKLNIKAGSEAPRRAAESSFSTGSDSDFDDFALAPPPGGKKGVRAPSSTQPTAASSSQPASSLIGDFNLTSTSSPITTSTAPAAAAATSAGDFSWSQFASAPASSPAAATTTASPNAFLSDWVTSPSATASPSSASSFGTFASAPQQSNPTGTLSFGAPQQSAFQPQPRDPFADLLSPQQRPSYQPATTSPSAQTAASVDWGSFSGFSSQPPATGNTNQQQWQF